MKLKKATERDIVKGAVARLKKRSSVRVCPDVPLLGRCADLIYIARGSIFSVEFKLKDWKKAIQQARDHRLGADFAYICMPERKISPIMHKEISESGLGLIFYRKNGRWPFKEIIKAPQSKETWQVAHTNIMEYVLSRQSKRRRGR